MKRVTAIFLSIILAVSLAACGQTGTEQQADMQTENSDNVTQGTDMEDKPVQVQETNVEDGFIRITGGTFQMESPGTESWCSDDETQHPVTVSDFYMAPYEVTQEEYEMVMGSNPSNFSGSDLPVESITWLEAISFCNAYSEEKGLEPVYSKEVNDAVHKIREFGSKRIPYLYGMHGFWRCGKRAAFVDT